jgi:hypothetical protein
MRALLAAETRKAIAAPTTWWLLLATAALGVAGTLPPLIAGQDTPSGRLTDEALQQAMHGAAAGVTLVIVAGVVAMAGEWRHGQITQTLLSTPRRRLVVWAKSLVYLVVGLAYGLAAALGAVVTAWLWYRGQGVDLPLTRSAVWLTLLGCVLVAALFGVLGVAIGAVSRNQVVGIVSSLGWLALVEPALFSASPSVFRWLPGMASFSIRRQPTDDLLAVGPAAAVVLAVVVAALAAGLRVVDRTDVTA